MRMYFCAYNVRCVFVELCVEKAANKITRVYECLYVNVCVCM